MSKVIFAVVVVLLSLDTHGCGARYAAAQPSKFSSPGHENRVAEQIPIYRNVSLLTWEETLGVLVEARLETLAGHLKDAPYGYPISVLTITNLTTGKVIFKQDNQDSPISMYVRNISDDGGNALVITWSGGSADRIEILAVDATQAHQILNEYYRLDATLISLSDGSVDVLITTAKGGAQPLYTTRYAWKEGRYVSTGTAPYKRLANIINSQFVKTRSRSNIPPH